MSNASSIAAVQLARAAAGDRQAARTYVGLALAAETDASRAHWRSRALEALRSAKDNEHRFAFGTHARRRRAA